MKNMQKKMSFICAIALLAHLMPAAAAQDSHNATSNITMNGTQNLTGNITLNATENAAQHTKVLRAGFENIKPINNLDVYGNKSAYIVPSSASTASAFSVSQRLGNASRITHSTDIHKPFYNASQYERTKPIYEVPDNLASKPVYSISGYSTIKAVNSIP